MAVYVEVVERVPYPVGIAVLVHVHDGVAEDGHVAALAGKVGVALGVAGEHHPMAVGQHQHVMVEAFELVGIALCVVEAGRGQERMVELGHVEGAHGVAGEVNLADLVDQVLRRRESRSTRETRWS